MCGRLVLTSSLKDRIKAIFAQATFDAITGSRYNVTPGQRIPVMTDPGMNRVLDMTWGFASTARPEGQASGSLLVNARSETVHRLPSFRDSFSQRRCLIFADGFYEWKRVPGSRPQPYYFSMDDSSPMIMAGIWTASRIDNEPACAIITTEANQLMHPVHNRMPVLLRVDGAELWLQPDANTETLLTLLQPYPSSSMHCHPVGFKVNKSDSEGADLIEPARIVEQTELF